ncbi:hypothetical protein ACFE04_017963 [Oxalis oulophora]
MSSESPEPPPTPMNITNLPNDLIARIASRLSLKSLARFRAVCKQFRDSTTDLAYRRRFAFAKSLSPVIMQHYVATRPMFIGVEVMNADTRLVLGNQSSQASPSNVSRGLSSLYKEITDTVRKEAATIIAVFPTPNDVMSILVQRVLEQRVTALLDNKLLVKPSLVNLPPMVEGGLLLYLGMLAVAYEKTQELARDLRAVGCGDLDIEGLTESLFSAHKDEYSEIERASLKQLFKAKLDELRAEGQQVPELTGSIGRSEGASISSSVQQISVTVVTEFARWNEEAISRCTLFSSQGIPDFILKKAAAKSREFEATYGKNMKGPATNTSLIPSHVLETEAFIQNLISIATNFSCHINSEITS